ncbi:putative DNA-(apurinic or apyrimidinic site) lyase, DNA-formamidopyrimidine glycosylase [Helianthus annuus]|uniref:DNA-(Apurinic or apyrimidinic site) lyase, DNA-formamidopyrimidine glycosylase n=1 Tax=Helianthus annuus TaxID=4232 RepID=A0A251VDL7_HELAN|nr:formamidopyrimidine-DNA glycosylase isoform X1 [Helianthus annuus]KAF5817025.1 putative DNA-(apurinic or apyrimidinic site) lyase, DNA-formamidopyrimidine glycosylase [Helianthus annuus]KAJ0603556.1 putative DNA-(apurinic or apyrimidinic site) lyase, DNA-formamidopyrimidine glycosylase [Helianthus annuus]KAJ0613667.1 putative DNA-(apurinic or apyrimidinic site) lyase, DNA-formamidopyrimidine glycosylase [Helianthus annuus]KAJ0617473.1 putative DNA-(apurinic or apyrimidinic site) lyase, DNA-f
MPELPEVEAARRAIAENCIGKKIIRSIVADDAKVIDGVSRADFEASLTGKTIVGAHRKGKNMWIELDSPPFPSFQFGMAGAIYIKGVAVTKYKRSAVSDTDEWPSKYSKVFIELDDGLELSFTDKRRFAKVRLLKNPATVAPISELGPDALLEPMTEDELFKALSKKKIAIKALLLDQSFISGVGNWIADEVLYQAKIHPLQSAATIPKEGCAALHKSLKEVIKQAVEVGADSSQYPSNWIFHSREKKPGKAFVDGKTIDFIKSGGRTTAYVPELQKLTGDQVVKAAVKPQKKSSNKNNDEAESEGEEIAKPKGGKKTTKSRAKKAPAKRKPDTSDDNDDDVDDEKKPATKNKSTGGNKKSTARKKSKESESDEDDGDGDEDEVKGKEEVAKKVQTGRPTRKRAK